MLHKLKYAVLPETLAVCRAVDGADAPAWAQIGRFSCVVRARDELSIVCEEKTIPNDHEGWLIEGGWAALRLEGPFPFAMTGVLESLIRPLAEAEIPVFAISTFDTDYVLVKRESLKEALITLSAAGHEEI